MESELTLYHGSSRRIVRPKYGYGNPYNDYGLGFYCTPHYELAQEWACPSLSNGYVNQYVLNTAGLATLHIDALADASLAWLALLVENRQFELTTPLMVQAKSFLCAKYLPNLADYDIAVGYRADDSYFSFARAFLDGRISLQQLEQAMQLGNLGQQIVLKSKHAFQQLRFEHADAVDASVWHPKRVARDHAARLSYRELSQRAFDENETYVLDLLRKG